VRGKRRGGPAGAVLLQDVDVGAVDVVDESGVAVGSIRGHVHVAGLGGCNRIPETM
jgi:hypothetical protein